MFKFKKNSAQVLIFVFSLVFAISVFACVYGFLFSKIPWDLVFSDTMISGGDTGSHNYIAYYSSEIFPRLKWWSNDWYAGFPFLYFYPPLLYYLTSFFSQFFSLNIVFKIVTLLGTFFLPICVFLSLHFIGFKSPIPHFGSAFSLAYLFLEKFSIYGGNIPSTLAGEFSFSFSFSLFFLFVGLLIKGIRENRYLLPNIIILSIIVLGHPFPVLIAVLVGILIFLEEIFKRNKEKIKRTFVYLAETFGLAFGVTAFWSLPFLMLLGYTSKMSWTKVIKLDEIFPSVLMPFVVMAGIGLFYALIKKEKRILLFFYIIISALLPYLFLNRSSIWNTRFLPFILVSFLILAAYALGSLLEEILKLLRKGKIIRVLALNALSLILISCFIFIYLPSKISYIPSWLKWNYEGFEKKSSWPEIKSLTDYLKNLPYGRIMWEYRPEYDKFGTPRILENLPIWTDKPTFEGLLIESSLSGYFHFINQTETTKNPTAAIAGMKYPSFNFENGVKHLRFFGAQYFVAYTQEIKNLAGKHFIKLADVGDFSVYQIERADLVEVVSDWQIYPKTITKEWLNKSIEWYKGAELNQPIVFYHNNKEKRGLTSLLNEARSIKISNQPALIEKITKNSIIFTTENVGLPHLVKYTYFPGWKIKGGKGPYLISPSFMMVVPLEKRVVLEFGYNIWDWLGILLGFLSVFAVLVISVFPVIQNPSRFLLSLKQRLLNHRG